MLQRDVAPGIHRVEDAFVNWYLVEDGPRLTIVDCGVPRSWGSLQAALAELGRAPGDVEAVLVTHPHPDHALGLFAVLEELPVGRFWRSSGEDDGDLYADLESACRRAGVPAAALPAGYSLRLAGARLDVLHSGGRRHKVDPVNNQSLVLLFEREGRRALLTGDAGFSTEDGLARTELLSPVDVLKVGHHGSRGSTSRAFVAALRPRAALISCGRENRFGHPAPETLATLDAAGAPAFRTDLSSDVRIELDARGATRLWRRGP